MIVCVCFMCSNKMTCLPKTVLLILSIWIVSVCSSGDDVKKWLDHCDNRNANGTDTVLSRKACSLECMHHLAFKQGVMTDDGLICAIDLAYACRDGLCRTSSKSSLMLDNVYNQALNQFNVSINATQGYLTICLSELANNQTIHDVELPTMNRKRCETCVLNTHTQTSTNIELNCEPLDNWNWHSQSILVLESWARLEADNDAFVGGSVFRFPSVVPLGQRVSTYQYRLVQDSTGGEHHIVRLIWHDV